MNFYVLNVVIYFLIVNFIIIVITSIHNILVLTFYNHITIIIVFASHNTFKKVKGGYKKSNVLQTCGVTLLYFDLKYYFMIYNHYLLHFHF